MPAHPFFSAKENALQIYQDLILPRRIEEKMLKLLRQNRISKWFSGIGQEAIAVGTARAMQPEDYILTMHRNLGIFTTRQVPLYPLFCQLFGKSDGFSGGRERSFHFGIPEYKIVGMISHLAAMLPVADGLALASVLKKENRAVVAFCGEGATSEGDFHEAVNLAAVWDLPVIFLIENNGYALSTPVSEQFRCSSLADKAVGYGMEGVSIDGNNIEEVLNTLSDARSYITEKQKPMLIEARTFRMRGHEEASGTAYVPKDLTESWARKDPVLQLETRLKKDGLLTDDEISRLKAKADGVFKEPLEKALQAPEPVFNLEEETGRVFAVSRPPQSGSDNGSPNEAPKRQVRFIDAVKLALEHEMKADSKTLIMGQDIAEYGGVFKVTEGFSDTFGRERVRNTPIIESGIVGAAIGLALDGFRPVVEMQFADFITCAFNQIVNNVAKSKYRWSPPLNITIRAPHGAGVGAGPFHSQSPESWFMQHSGLKIVVPSSAEDAFHLLASSLADPNPVLFFEHKALYRSVKGEIPEHPHYEELGRAKVVKEGADLSIITYGMGVHWALDAAAEIEQKRGITVEIVDLRTLVPLDFETVQKSIHKTNRGVLLEESFPVLGPMAEISAQLQERCFQDLDAPLMRCSSLNIPVPFSPKLEKHYLAKDRLMNTLERVLDY